MCFSQVKLVANVALFYFIYTCNHYLFLFFNFLFISFINYHLLLHVHVSYAWDFIHFAHSASKLQVTHFGLFLVHYDK